MKKCKVKISFLGRTLVLILAFCIYAITYTIYNIISGINLYSSIYVFNKPVYAGEVLNENDIVQIKVCKTDKIKNYVSDKNNVVGKVLTSNFSGGSLVYEDKLCSNEEYEKEKNTELVSIKIENQDKYIFKRYNGYDKFNIDYTGENEQLDSINNALKGMYVIKGSEKFSVRIVENVSILNVYDIYGKEVPMEKIENVDNLFLVCKVNKNLSVLINNLKDYGKFNLSIGR